MGQMPSRYSDDTQEEFHQLLAQRDFNELQLICEYFKNDLIYIVASASEIKQMLEHMESRNILNKEIYLQMRSDLGPFMFSEKLLQEILEAGREAIMGFLEGIYNLQFFNSPSHLYELRDELDRFGDSLMQQILLDRNGHPLTPELKEIQEHHKQHLLQTAIPKPSESTGQNKDFYVSDRYMDLIASHVRPFHRSAKNKLLETAAKHRDYFRNDVGSVSPYRLFRWCQWLKCEPHVVMVTGVPGIGKTTLLQKLVCDWANGKFYQGFSFIFFLRFRDLNKLEKISLESMILQEYPYLENQLGNILQNPERLLFIFDGLDESVHEINFKSGQLPHDIKQVANVGAVVVGLAKQTLLKGCRFLMTSQPNRLAGKNINICRRALEVIGFLPKESQLYIERFFMNKEISDKVLGFLRENSVLNTFCYNPSYCWIICTVLSKCFKGQPTNDDQIMPSLPKTLTQLFAAFIADVLSNLGSDKFTARSLLTSIGWMAEHGVINRITKFKKHTFAQFNVDRTSKLLPGLMKEYTCSPEASFSFLHPITQEFLAALVHYIDYSPEKLHDSLERAKSFKDNYGELFLSFLCGLSDISTRTILEPYLGDLSSDAAKDVLSWLQQEVTELDPLEKTRLLSICFKFFEQQNKAFCSECLGSFRSFNFYQEKLTPLDCSVVSFTIQSLEEIDVLGLGQCDLQRDDVERFAPALHKIHSIGFYGFGFGDDAAELICSALKHPDCKIHTLCLSLTGLTDRACSYFGPAISANKSLRILRLSNNRLDGPHFGDLMTALSSPSCKLEELDLSSNWLMDNSCSLLASGIRSNQSLKILILSSNYLICPYFGDLMQALSSPTCMVEQLELQDILLDDEHFPLMMPLSNNKNLTYLDLRRNSVTGASTPYLRELILQSPNLKRVSLFFNHNLSLEDRRSLRELEAQKPGLYI